MQGYQIQLLDKGDESRHVAEEGRIVAVLESEQMARSALVNCRTVNRAMHHVNR